MDSIFIKISALVVVQSFVNIIRTNVTRHIVKTQFSTSEIPMSQWFTPKFIFGLSFYGFLGLAIIASFTLVTFPLGIWIGSFRLGLSYPITRIITLATRTFMLPINLLVMNKTIQEMALNQKTLGGLGLIELSTIIAITGWTMIYYGNK